MTMYSDLPNNCAANLIIFWKKNTYTTLLGPTRLLFLRFFLQNLIFTYINEKKSFLHSLIKTYTFINFEKSATYTIKWYYTIIWQVRVAMPES